MISIPSRNKLKGLRHTGIQEVFEADNVDFQTLPSVDSVGDLGNRHLSELNAYFSYFVIFLYVRLVEKLPKVDVSER